MKGHFSLTLIEAITKSLALGEQIILFQKTVVIFTSFRMRLVVMYRNVSNDVSLTYHKFKNQLRCHYCGYALPNLPIAILVRVSIFLQKIWYGTNRIELVELLPTKTSSVWIKTC
jgi:primosomal protein N' (replication factor Y)